MNILLILLSASSFIILICFVRNFSGEYTSVEHSISIEYLDGLIQDSSNLLLSNNCMRSMETTELISLSYEFDIIAVTGMQPLTPFQLKVFQSVAMHIETEVSNILLPGYSLFFHTKIRHDENMMVSFTKNEKDIHSLNVENDLDNQCISLQFPCRKLSIIFYLPTQLSDVVHNISEGYMLSKHSCTIPLRLQNTADFDPADAAAVYSATALASQCAHQLFGMHTPSIGNAYTLDVNPAAADRATISSTEAQCFRSQHTVLLVRKAVDKFKALGQLYKYRDSIWAWTALSHNHREKVRNILRMCSEVRSILDSKLNINSKKTDQQMECQNPGGGAIQSLAVSILREAMHLEMSPEGYLQAPVPLEQHFAVFGPYWLPLLVPAFRALRLLYCSRT